MTFNPKQVAEAFSTHEFEATYPYLSDDITWNLINGEVIQGKEAVIKTCEESSKYLSSVKTTFIKFKTLGGENSVVIDSLAAYVDKNNERAVVASCDIYEFQGDKVHEITSYTVEISQAR